MRFGNPVRQAWSRITSEWASPCDVTVPTELVSLSAGVFSPELMEACQELEELKFQQYQVRVHGNQTMSGGCVSSRTHTAQSEAVLHEAPSRCPRITTGQYADSLHVHCTLSSPLSHSSLLSHCSGGYM